MNAIMDILSEDFEVPDCNADLQELIDECSNEYKFMPMNKGSRLFKSKLNELIAIYNERRGMKIYCKI